jgi:hypothetical protein
MKTFKEFKDYLIKRDPAYKFTEKAELEALFQSWLQNEIQKNHSTGPGKNKPVAKMAFFTCYSCEATVRCPLGNITVKCPSCKTAYSISRINGDAETYTIYPKPSKDVGNGKKSNKSNVLPEKINKAFMVLRMNAQIHEWFVVQKTYRAIIASYHPDKVAHLGEDLRFFAEYRSKEINTAYEILREYYKTIEI